MASEREEEEADGSRQPLTERERLVRKLRKKLRQIEHLETLGRALNEEERRKVEAKASIRRCLEEALAELRNMKRRSAEAKPPQSAPAAGDGRDGGETVSKRPRPDDGGGEVGAAAAAGTPLLADGLGKGQQLEVSVSHRPAPAVLQDAEPSSSTREAATTVATTATTAAGRAPAAADFVQVKVSTLDRSKGRGRRGRPAPGLAQRDVVVRRMEPGHEDLVLAADLDLERDVAVTAGRDTVVLAWRLSAPFEQVSSLRGHTGAVTAVRLLPSGANGRLGRPEEEVVAVSGSLDCSLKLWDVSAGTMIRSIYTYNGIRCLSSLWSSSGAGPRVLTGTDGGKIELFDLSGGCAAACSVRGHDDVVTAVDSRDLQVVSASRDGMLKVWQVQDGADGGGGGGGGSGGGGGGGSGGGGSGVVVLRCLFVSEDVRPAEEDQATHLRCVLSARYHISSLGP